MVRFNRMGALSTPVITAAAFFVLAFWAGVARTSPPRNGVHKTFHTNGKKQIVASYSDGKKHGRDRRWREDGKLSWDRQWKNGQKHGRHRFWYANGKLFNDFMYRDGIKHGRWRSWSLTGKPSMDPTDGATFPKAHAY